MTTPLAKSLHTHSVLVNLGRYLQEVGGLTPQESVEQAVRVLQLDGKPDPYGLIARAKEALSAELVKKT
jgi:hypothetical protein